MQFLGMQVALTSNKFEQRAKGHSEAQSSIASARSFHEEETSRHKAIIIIEKGDPKTIKPEFISLSSVQVKNKYQCPKITKKLRRKRCVGCQKNTSKNGKQE